MLFILLDDRIDDHRRFFRAFRLTRNRNCIGVVETALLAAYANCDQIGKFTDGALFRKRLAIRIKRNHQFALFRIFADIAPSFRDNLIGADDQRVRFYRIAAQILRRAARPINAVKNRHRVRLGDINGRIRQILRRHRLGIIPRNGHSDNRG